MPAVHETAYPRLTSSVSERDLAAIYTPTAAEVALAAEAARGVGARLGFLVTLKTMQRLGYPVPTASVPPAIVAHIARAAELPAGRADLAGYDRAGTRTRHLAAIRAYLQLRPADREARKAMVRAMATAARTKDEPADLINVGLEELVRLRCELPAFGTLARAAVRVRAAVARAYYRQVGQALTDADRTQLDALFATDPATGRSPWHALRQDPGRPTLTTLRTLIAHLTWVAEQPIGVAALAGLPTVKVRQFAAEADTLDAGRMLAMAPAKRATLAACLLAVRAARARDDLGELLIKRLASIHRAGREALARYRQAQQQRTDALIATLQQVVTAYQTEGGAEQRLAAIDAVLGERVEEVLQQCEEHGAYAGDNYYPFLWAFFRSHRAALFHLLRAITLRSTSQDTALEDSIRFLRQREGSRGRWLVLPQATAGEGAPLDLGWIPERWWRLVSDGRRPDEPLARVDRRHFEVCVFSQLLWELKAGDLAIVGSDAFADYRDQLVSWAEYEQLAPTYGQQVALPMAGAAFVERVRGELAATASAVDRAFPQNQEVRLEGGVPVIRRPQRRPTPEGLAVLEDALAARLEPVGLLDVLADADHWLGLTSGFGPVSGHEAKLEDAAQRYLTALFCYGCHLGPTQTTRSLGAGDRRQLAWVHQRHITEDNLDEAIRLVVNGYNRFRLPRFWGSGKSAAADGTKWDLYESNLLAEYHIRYQGYGGIGYYHVSDT